MINPQFSTVVNLRGITSRCSRREPRACTSELAWSARAVRAAEPRMRWAALPVATTSGSR